MDEKSLWKFISCTTYPIGLGDQRDALMRHTATPVSLSFPFGLLWRDATPSSPLCTRRAPPPAFSRFNREYLLWYSEDSRKGENRRWSRVYRSILSRNEESRVAPVEHVAGIIGLATK